MRHMISTEMRVTAADHHKQQIDAEAWALDERLSWMFDMLMSASKAVVKEAERVEALPHDPKRVNYRLREYECNLVDVSMEYAKLRRKSQSVWRKLEKAEKEFAKLAAQLREEQRTKAA